MFRRTRATAPAALVPLAWGFVTVAHLGFVSDRTLLAAHVVMAALLAAFAVLSRSEMRDGALRVWWWVVVAGFGLTLAGAAGLLAAPGARALLWLAVVGWMALPAVGLLDTGRRPVAWPRVHLAGGALSGLGALAYALAPVLGGRGATLSALALAGAGQTAAIVAAVVAD